MGKFLVILTVVAALAAGAGIYYTQVYAYYFEVAATGPEDVMLTPLQGGDPEPLPHTGFEAIDSNSSPIRYRACFTTTLTLDELSARFVPYPNPVPLTGPGWFGCYDAETIGDALDLGEARAFLGLKNVHYGVDRVVGVTRDGRGFVWQQVNDCGERSYDGTEARDDCPKFEQGK